MLGRWGPRNEANITQLSGTNYVSTMLLVVRNFRLKFTRSLNFNLVWDLGERPEVFDLGNLQPNKWEKTKALKLLIQWFRLQRAIIAEILEMYM